MKLQKFNLYGFIILVHKRWNIEAYKRLYYKEIHTWY